LGRKTWATKGREIKLGETGPDGKPDIQKREALSVPC